MQQTNPQNPFFLCGQWQGKGKIIDSDKNIEYGEHIEITHMKGPVHLYIQKTKKLPEGTPLHSETGYIRIFPSEQDPSKGQIEFMIAQPFGVCEIETGEYTQNSLKVECKKDQIIRTNRAKEPHVTEVQREFWLNENNELEYKMNLGTTKYEARHHLSAKLAKIQ